MKRANKIIEILGFGDKEITEFVQDSFTLDNAQSGKVFLQQLEEHPQLYSLCHVNQHNKILLYKLISLCYKLPPSIIHIDANTILTTKMVAIKWT